MTDKQPEALRLAAWLHAAAQICPQLNEDEPGGYASEVDQVMDEAAAELRRLHAENETLRAGYEAARLEIESLKSQLHAAKQSNAAQFGLLAASIPGSARPGK